MANFIAYIRVHGTVFAEFAIFVGTFLLRITYFAILGIQPANDTRFYLGLSEALTLAGGNILAFVDMNIPFYYWLYPTMLAALGNNLDLMIVIHIILHAITAVLLYRIGCLVYNKWVGILAGAGFALLWEAMHWSLYILTDTVFIFFLVAAVYAYLLMQRKQTTLNRVVFYTLLLLILFLRPTSIPFFGAILTVRAAGWRRSWKVAFILVALILSGSLLWLLLFVDPGHRLGLTGYVHYFISLYEQGVVIRDRPEFDVSVAWDAGFTITNIFTFFQITLYRLIAFWFVYVSSFSFSHIAVNILTLIPLYVFGIIGAFRGMRDRYSRSFTQLLVFIITFFWFFHSVTEVDYDFRYRLPVLPFLLLLAAYGASDVGKKALLHLVRYQIVRYGLVGIAVLAIDFLILNLGILVLHFGVFWSTFLGFVSGASVGYLLHSRWTFHYDTHGRELLKFFHLLFVAIVGLVLTEIIMITFTHNLNIDHNMAKVVAVSVSALWAYGASKWWVFR